MKKSFASKELSPCLVLFLIIIFFIIPRYSAADTKFISGNTHISVKDTFEKPNKNVGTVKTGDQVEILEENDHFARIRTNYNVAGWISLQFLQTEAPKNESNNKLKEEIAILKKKNNQNSAIQASLSSEGGLNEEQKKNLLQSVDSLKMENKHLLEENQRQLHMIQEHERSAQIHSSEKGEVQILKEKIAVLQNKLDVLTGNSKDIINITKEKDALADEVGLSRTELSKVKERNRKLENENQVYWFLSGALVFFIGLLSSKLFTRKKNKLSF
jgi:SH3 domain protein